MTEHSAPDTFSDTDASATRWPELHPLARTLERVAVVLDSALRIPGTRIRIGLDPLLGLFLPGTGDAAGGVLSLGAVFLALHYRLPLWVVARMVWNIGVDSGLGSIPVLGDVFDVLFKSNQRNFDLLRLHQSRTEPARVPVTYWLAAGALLLLAAICVTLPFVIAGYLLQRWLRAA